MARQRHIPTVSTVKGTFVTPSKTGMLSPENDRTLKNWNGIENYGLSLRLFC